MPRRKREDREPGGARETRDARETRELEQPKRRTRKPRVEDPVPKNTVPKTTVPKNTAPEDPVCGICGRGKQRGNPLHKVVLSFQVDDTGYSYNDWMCKECLEYFPGFLAGSLYFGGLATNKGKLSNFMLPPVQLTLGKLKSPK